MFHVKHFANREVFVSFKQATLFTSPPVRSSSLSSRLRSLEAGLHTCLKFGDQLLIGPVGNRLGGEWFAYYHVNGGGAWGPLAARPGFVGSRYGHGEECCSAAAGYGTDARFERGELACFGASALGENEYQFSLLEAAESLFDALQAEAIAVDGDGIEEPNQPAEGRRAEQALASEVVHAAIHRQAG